jgi:1,4-dihydroxy-2-naphthoate octaprenyltransferase
VAEGARPRTLPAALAPPCWRHRAAALDGFPRGALPLVVALALQVGVNYANDYSDGVRGTDTDRVGPLRLVGSGVASPAAVAARRWPASGSVRRHGFVLSAHGVAGGSVVGACLDRGGVGYTGTSCRTATAGLARCRSSSSSASSPCSARRTCRPSA